MTKNPTYITALRWNDATVSLSNTESNLSKCNTNMNKGKNKWKEDNTHGGHAVPGSVKALELHTKWNMKLKDNFLDYLIQEQTSFADLHEIESYYKKLAIYKYSIYNHNIIRIKKWELRYVELLLACEKELIVRYTLQKQSLDQYYDDIITKLNVKIKLYSHSWDCYSNMYRRLYKANYWIKKRWEEEFKFDVATTNQFEKYEILNSHALMTVKHQSSMLESIKNFSDLTRMTYNADWTKKTKQLNELEFQVIVLKNDRSLVEKDIHELKKEQNKVIERINQSNYFNQKNMDENTNYTKEYYTLKSKLLNIYAILKIENWDQIIKIFNKQQKEYLTLKSMFSKINSEIATLNNTYTTLSKIYQDTMTKVDEIKQHSVRGYDIDKMDTEAIVISEKKDHIDRIVNDIEKHKTRSEQIFMLTFIFMFNYIDKMLASVKSSYQQNNVTYTTKYEKLDKSKRFWLYSKDTTSHVLNVETLIHAEINEDLVKFCIWVFNDFTCALYSILSSSLNLICGDEMNNNEQLTNNKKYVIIPLHSPLLLKSYEKCVNIAFSHWERKMKIYRRKRGDIFQTRKSKSNKTKIMSKIDLKTQTKHTFIQFDDLYSEFMASYPKDSIVDNSKFILDHPKRNIILWKKYANENVLINGKRNKFDLFPGITGAYVKDTDTTINMNTSNWNTMNTRSNSMTTIEKKQNLGNRQMMSSAERIKKAGSLNPLKMPKTKSMSDIYREYDYITDDHDLSDANYSNSVSWKHKTRSTNLSRLKERFMIVTNDPHQDKLYERMNDIRKLELYYFQDKNKKVWNAEQFNEIYYQFKKKNNIKEGNVSEKKVIKVNVPKSTRNWRSGPFKNQGSSLNIANNSNTVNYTNTSTKNNALGGEAVNPNQTAIGGPRCFSPNSDMNATGGTSSMNHTMTSNMFQSGLNSNNSNKGGFKVFRMTDRGKNKETVSLNYKD